MRIKRPISAISLVVLLASCATHQEVTVEKKKGVTVVHHRSIRGNKAVDHIETITAKGVLTQATIEVYDVGRLPDGHGGMTEAHRYYRMTQTPTFDLRLPPKSGNTGTGPRTVYTPPNYSPPPNDQRVNDAVAEAQKAREKLQAAEKEVQARLAQDNALRAELQTQMSQNQALTDQLNAAFATSHAGAPRPTPTPSEAAKEAAGDVDQLTNWANQQQ